MRGDLSSRLDVTTRLIKFASILRPPDGSTWGDNLHSRFSARISTQQVGMVDGILHMPHLAFDKAPTSTHLFWRARRWSAETSSPLREFWSRGQLEGGGGSERGGRAWLLQDMTRRKGGEARRGIKKHPLLRVGAQGNASGEPYSPSAVNFSFSRMKSITASLQPSMCVQRP